MSPWMVVAAIWAVGFLLVCSLCVAAGRADRAGEAHPPQPTVVMCERCQGLGSVRHPSYGGAEFVTCPLCGGSGVVTESGAS